MNKITIIGTELYIDRREQLEELGSVSKVGVN